MRSPLWHLSPGRDRCDVADVAPQPEPKNAIVLIGGLVLIILVTTVFLYLRSRRNR